MMSRSATPPRRKNCRSLSAFSQISPGSRPRRFPRSRTGSLSRSIATTSTTFYETTAPIYAKALGKGRAERFAPEMRSEDLRRLELEVELRRAVAADDLTVHFQPVVALATGAKSFRDNRVIGSPALNRLGLHVRRTKLAHEIAWRRRRRLEHLVSAEDRIAFTRDGFVLKRDYLGSDEFARLKRAVLALEAPAREMVQGDTIAPEVSDETSIVANTVKSLIPCTRAFSAGR